MDKTEDFDENETFQQWAERCWRDDGEEIPPPGTAEWQAKYEAFIEEAFKDFSYKKPVRFDKKPRKSRR